MHYFTDTETNQLMMLKEIIGVYCDHTKRINTISGQNAEFYYVKPSDAYGDHRL
jgi:hypothetical protein